MASSSSSSFIFDRARLSLLFSLLLLAAENLPPVSSRGPAESYHIINVESLLPESSCSHQDTAAASQSKLKVVHQHGPCSSRAAHPKPSHVKFLREDQARVDSINRRAAAAATVASKNNSPVSSSLSTTLPANTGTTLGTGNYIVTIGLGTPKKDFTVVFDTGSDLTWTQCSPCDNCYSQQDPIYDPAQSSTYTNFSCSSTYCNELDQSSCTASSACQYQVQYGDNSQTQGTLISDTLSFGSDSIPNFRYGCGHDNSGLFGKSDGLMGLGREPVSIVSQTSQRYGSVFSYCLPSKSSNTGYLELGSSGRSSGVQYTSMLTNPNMPSFYFLRLIGIAVAAQRLALSPAIFSTPGTLIDSGTVITRLPPAAYTALRDRFRQLMTQYPRAPALSILDTCYNFSGVKTAKVPTVGLVFDDGLTVNMDFSGILYLSSISQACLAFAGNTDPSEIVIVGNVQQRKLSVVYDVANSKIGFGPNGCS